jgi:hypothetical protein
MAIQNEPTRIQIPFADAGTKNVIPDTNSTPSASQAASWTDGFPAQCSLPLSAGGIPPARADFNGILNTMTQSERFTQEGGVWLWSNAVDYGASRMVRGSNGNLYWSVAQSGPSVGGAVNPITDNGTYWVKLPSMADIAAMNYATQSWVTGQGYATRQSLFQNNGAGPNLDSGIMPYALNLVSNSPDTVVSSAWVKSLGVASIYIAPNGDDSKDGLSSSAAVKTFSKALEIGTNISKNGFRIFVASGTYNDTLNLNSNSYTVPLRVQLVLQGDVALTGGILCTNSEVVVRSENNLIVSAPSDSNGVSIYNSKFVCYATVTIFAPENKTGLYVDLHSNVYFQKLLSVDGGENFVNCGISVFGSSALSVDAGCYVHGASFGDGIRVENSSSMNVRAGTVSISPSAVYNAGLIVTQTSNFIANDDVSSKGGYNSVLVDAASSFIMRGGELYLYDAPTACLDVANASCAYLWVNKLTCLARTGGTDSFILTQFNSTIYLGSGTVTFNGQIVDMLKSIICSSIIKNNGVTFGGSVSGTARRFNIVGNSALDTSGDGNNICSGVSGNSAGTTSSGGIVL